MRIPPTALVCFIAAIAFAFLAFQALSTTNIPVTHNPLAQRDIVTAAAFGVLGLAILGERR